VTYVLLFMVVPRLSLSVKVSPLFVFVVLVHERTIPKKRPPFVQEGVVWDFKDMEGKCIVYLKILS
jgi:hypothetical protein